MKFKLLLFLVFFALICNGQTVPKIMPPSADATALGIYGKYPISLSNGTPEINVPIYEIKTNKLSIPISLSYHANGIKVNELASNVGLGWTLNTGGAITRQLNHLNDFDYNGFGNIVVPGLDRKLSSIGVQEQVYDEIRSYAASAIDNLLGNLDAQPDNFFFNFANNSGEFLLKNAIAKDLPYAFSTIPYKPIDINYDKVNGRFSIIDENGVKYLFGKSITDGSGAYETTSVDNGLPNITAWYLTEMISADKSDTLSFKYNMPKMSSIGYIAKSNTLNYVDPPEGGTPGPLPGYYLNSSQETDAYQNSNITLNEIRFKTGKAVFEYGNRDDQGTDKLESIKIYAIDNNQYVERKRFTFDYSYFTSVSPQEPGQIFGIKDGALDKRLRLDRFSEKSAGNGSGMAEEKPAHQFEYYSLNGKISSLGEYGQDLWGYWNGASNNNLIINNPPKVSALQLLSYNSQNLVYGIAADRKPDFSHLVAGTIKSITYPTGGTTEFEFGSNKFLRKYTTETPINQNYQYYLTNGSAGGYGPSYTDKTFAASVTVNASLTLNFFNNDPNNNCTDCISNEPVVILMDLTTGTRVLDINFLSNPPSNLSVELTGGHQYRFYTPKPGAIAENTSAKFKYGIIADLKYSSQTGTTVTENTETVLSGGLRIEKITNKTSAGIASIKQFDYVSSYLISPDIFFGDFSYVAARHQFPVYRFIPNALPIKFLSFGENTTIPLAGSSNGSLAYDRVEEFDINENGDRLGKTVHYFNKVIDESTYALLVGKKTDLSWQRKQILREEMYKRENNIYKMVKSITNSYADVFELPGDTIKSYDFHPMVIHPSVNGGAFYGLANNSGADINNEYYIGTDFRKISRNALTAKKEVVYSLNSLDSVSSFSNYFYNNANNMRLSRTEVARSNGDKLIERTIYNTDLQLNNCEPGNCYNSLVNSLSTLKSQYYSNNIPVFNQWFQYRMRRFNIEVGCVAYDLSCLGQHEWGKYDSEIVSLYNQFQNLKTNYENSVAQAVSQYNTCSTTDDCFLLKYNSSPQNIQALLQMEMDKRVEPVENITSVIKSSDSQEYILGAGKSEYQITDGGVQPWKNWVSEFDGNLLYNIYIVNPSSYLRNTITFDLFKKGNLVQVSESHKKPVCYLWGYKRQYPAVKITGSYYSVISGLIDQNIMDNGNDSERAGQFSALRAHFLQNPDVQLETFTYKPLVGMTSQTDAKGMTTTYEYDGFQRLKTIKDQNGNILKQTDYHYKN